MPDKNESEKRSSTIYYSMPELKDLPAMNIALDVDALLSDVMERGQVATERLEQFIEFSKQNNNPEFLLERKKHFLALLLSETKDKHLPDAFFPTLMRIAVYEANPSFNRGFIEPCLRAFGYRKVQEALLNYLVRGTNREKAGAARAFYWAQLPLLLPNFHALYQNHTWHDQGEFEQALREHSQNWEEAKQAFQKMLDEELVDLRSKIAVAMLKEFIENDNLDVRQSLIPQLSFDPLHYSEAWKSLLSIAIYIARTHPDDYIRHRVEIQLKRVVNPEG